MMLELRLLWKSTSQKQIGTKFLVPKNLMLCFARQSKMNKVFCQSFPSIEVPLPNDSPLDLVWKLVGKNCKLLWFEGDLSPSSLDVTYECEKMMVSTVCYCSCFLITVPVFLYFWHELCVNMSRWLLEPICISFNWFFLLEVIEENEKCGKMFKEDRMMVNGI